MKRIDWSECRDVVYTHVQKISIRKYITGKPEIPANKLGTRNSPPKESDADSHSLNEADVSKEHVKVVGELRLNAVLEVAAVPAFEPGRHALLEGHVGLRRTRCYEHRIKNLFFSIHFFSFVPYQTDRFSLLPSLFIIRPPLPLLPRAPFTTHLSRPEQEEAVLSPARRRLRQIWNEEVLLVSGELAQPRNLLEGTAYS